MDMLRLVKSITRAGRDPRILQLPWIEGLVN